MTDRRAQSKAAERNTATQGTGASLLSSPLLWGAALTVGFYAVLPYLPVQQEFLRRYFCGHWLEYCETGLFFLGMAMLAGKARALAAEQAALATDPIDERRVAGVTDPVERTEVIADSLRAVSPRLNGTYLIERLRDVCAFIRGRRSSEGLEEHLKYLAEQSDARTYESYGLVRTVTWAIPILGFLGTVIGITMAIANVTPEQLDTSLTTVTAGLAVAFDTTALALALSLVLVFASFAINRAENQVLMQVEDYGTRRLLVLFPPAPQAGGALNAAERQAAATLIHETEALIEWQTKLWQESLEGLRDRWTSTLAAQQSRFDEALQSGMASTLDDHARQLAAVRGEFLQAFADTAQQLREELAESRAADRERQEALYFQLDALWQRVRTELGTLRDDEARQRAELAGAISTAVGNWQAQLERCTAAAAEQSVTAQLQTESLERLVGTNSELIRLEERLTENLEAVRAAETFEQTLHSLSAAVHLLTARSASRAA